MFPSTSQRAFSLLVDEVRTASTVSVTLHPYVNLPVDRVGTKQNQETQLTKLYHF
jgi:hypothetical protein